MNEVEMAKDEIAEITTRPKETGVGILEANTDNILYLAEKAERYIEAMNRIMEAALKITNELDWILIGGKPYLQESGSMKVARLFGISIQLLGTPDVTCDDLGYKTFTYTARFMLNNQYVECDGSRSMKDDFFAKQGKDKPLKKPDEIEERDVKRAAYTNCLNNGIKRLIPNLRNIDVNTLENAGLDVKKISGYTFKEGSKGGQKKTAEESGLVCSKCGAAVSQKVASYSQAKHGVILCMECQKGA